MPAISIPCPSCGAVLKVPDNSMLGKRAKCPKCAHRFVMELPQSEEVPLQLADIPVLPLAPQVGTGARWVPDEGPAIPQPEIPVFDSMPRGSVSPRISVPEPESQMPDILAFTPVGSAQTPTAELDFAPSAIASSAIAPSTVKSSKSTGRKSSGKRRRGNRAGLVVMGLVAVVVAGVSYAAFVMNKGQGTAVVKGPAVNVAWEAQKVEMAASNETAQSMSPTSGKSIPLDHLPFTPHLLFHVHPMELWTKTDRTTAEFNMMLGNLALWLASEIEESTLFKPSDISELTYAINFGPRMSKPDVAAVVRLREPHTKSELEGMFRAAGGKRHPDPETVIYDSSELSFMLIDDRTFVVAPASLSEDLKMSRNDAALASPDMENLVQESDRDRLVTLMFDVKILDSHREDIFAFIPELRQVFEKFVSWIGTEVETVSWSMHLDPAFYMETLLHNSSDSSVLKVQRQAQLQFSKLAEEMLAGVKKMKPNTVGSRQMIGRFPAMLQALDVGTTAHVGPACARLVTVLPRHASVNLAAGALLTWNQSLLTNFEEEVKVTKDSGSSVPDKLVDRLQMKVLIDFRRTPLEEAFGYIGESIKTEVSIDGDALKGAGFTQNMPQTFDLGTVTAQAALHEIIKKYAAERDPLVLIVDEKAKKLILSTKVKSETEGVKPFDTSPKP